MSAADLRDGKSRSSTGVMSPEILGTAPAPLPAETNKQWKAADNTRWEKHSQNLMTTLSNG